MKNSRVIKYSRIREFQQKRIDLLKQKIAAQQQQVGLLKKQRQERIAEMRLIESELSFASQLLVGYEQSTLALQRVQQLIDESSEQIQQAESKLEILQQLWQREDRQLKSWEKLIELEQERLSSAHRIIDMRNADDRFLNTQFAGEYQ